MITTCITDKGVKKIFDYLPKLIVHNRNILIFQTYILNITLTMIPDDLWNDKVTS